MRKIDVVFDTNKVVSGEVFKSHVGNDELAYLLKCACLSAVKHSVGKEASSLFRASHRSYPAWVRLTSGICWNGCGDHPIVRTLILANQTI